MDKTDQKILYKLEENCRYSVSYIARSLRLSKDVVRYRLDKMEKEQFLRGYRTVLDMGKLGYQYYRLLLQNSYLHSEQEKEWITWIKKQPELVWVAGSDGEWNSIITIRVRSLKELQKFMDHLLVNYGRFLYKKEIMSFSQIHMINKKYLAKKPHYEYQLTYDFFSKKVPIDETDEKILAILTKNARIKLTEISSLINLSPESIARRIRNLQKTGVIVGFRLQLDYTKLGLQNFEISLSVRSPDERKKIIAYYLSHPDCYTIMEFLGRYDLQISFLLRNQAEFRYVLGDMRNRFSQDIVELYPIVIFQEFITNPLE